jgi:hypothetical protein
MENKITFAQKREAEKEAHEIACSLFDGLEDIENLDEFNDAYFQNVVKFIDGWSKEERELVGYFYAAVLEEWGWTCTPPKE